MSDDRWERYLYERHSRGVLSSWARALQFFRFCRAYGGHSNDGDQLLVALRFESREELVATFERLGIPLIGLPPDEPKPVFGKAYKGEEFAKFRIGIRQFPEVQQPGRVTIAGVLVHAWVNPGRLELSVSEEDDPYEVSNHTIQLA